MTLRCDNNGDVTMAKELEVKDGWTATHWTTNGVPDGGQSYGIGFCIAWQRGSLKDNGRNGAFIMEVLEACLDELRWKNRQFPSPHNEFALSDLECCLGHLHDRMEARKAEGTQCDKCPASTL